MKEQCSNCKYYHRLKHNFRIKRSFQESHCCDVLLHLPDATSEAWVQETEPEGMCEMFTEVDNGETGI